MAEAGQLAVVLLVGTAVGWISGLFGVGGGFLSVPALTILAGIEPRLAIGCSVCQALGPATTGLFHRLESGRLPVQMPLTMLCGVLLGQAWGFAFLRWAQGPHLETTLMATYLGILVSLAVVVIWEYHASRDLKPGQRRGWLEGWPLPPMVAFEELNGRPASLTYLAIFSILFGFLNGGLGVGGGILLVPLLIFLIGVPTRLAVSVALSLTWCGGVFATCGHALAGAIDLRLVSLLLIGGTLGAKYGSEVADRIPPRRLRGWFAGIILTVAAMVAVRLAGRWAGGS